MSDRKVNPAQRFHHALALFMMSMLCALLPSAAAGQVTLSAASLNFGSVVLNSTSAPVGLTVTNNQATALPGLSFTLPALTLYAISPAPATTCLSGGTVNPGASCTITLTFKPKSGSIPTSSSLTVNTTGKVAQKVALSGTAVAQVTLSTNVVNFSSVALNEKSAVHTVTLTNNQAVALSITSIGPNAGSEFALDAMTTTCPHPGTVATAASCTIGLTFTPSALGVRPAGSLAVNANATTPAVSLTGTGVPQVLLSLSSVTFPAQFVGTASSATPIQITNEQLFPLNISSVTVTGANGGDFQVSNPCPTALLPGQSCTISVAFKPTVSGTTTATLNLNDDAPGGGQTLALSGSANAPVTLSTDLISNFTAPVGSLSTYQTVTITNNNSAAALQIYNLQFSGDFQKTSTSCGSAAPYTLAPGAACNVTVSFAPTVGGTRTGQLLVNDNAGTSPQVVNLSGYGTAPLTVTPSSLIFSAEKLGTVSPSQSLTLTNHESQRETFAISVAGTSDYTTTSNCLNGVIAANSTCTIAVVFAPPLTETPGPVLGTMTITDSAPGSISCPVTPVVGGLCPISLTGSATSQNPPAAVQWVSPGAGAAGTTVNVIITGNNWTHFSPSSVISFVDTDSSSSASDITVQSFTAPDPNHINATLLVAGGAGTIYGARDIYVNTPLSSGGTETAYLFQAFIIADPTNAHVITGLLPPAGTQGQTYDVTVTATGTHFVQGTTIANFGDGVNVNWLTVLDATHAVANVTISNWTLVGYRTVTLATGGEFAVTGYDAVSAPSGIPTFQILSNNATLLSVSPNSGGQGWAGPVLITASGSHFVPNATQVSIGGGVIVGDLNVLNPTTATAQVAIPANATPGAWDVTVSTGGEIESLAGAFTVINTTPALTVIAPDSGAQGQTLDVLISGNAFTSFNQSAISADFTGEIRVNSVTVLSTSQVKINITISQIANAGGITANLISGSTIFPFGFSVTPSSARISSVAPINVPQGAQVTLTIVGSNTHWVQGTTNSAFYPIPFIPVPAVDQVTVNNATDAQLNIAVPVDEPVGDYAFWMATGGEVVSASIHVYAHTPTLTMSPANGLVPSSGTNSFTVNFTGQFTHFQQSTPPLATDTLPVIAGQGVTLSNFTVTSQGSATATLTISAGAATGPRLVTFTTGTEIVKTNFNVAGTPASLVSVDPWNAGQNLTLDVAIVGQYTHFASGTTQVLFGPQITVNSITVTDATHLTASISTSYIDTVSSTLTATPPGWETVYVNTGSEQVIGGFLVDPPATPTIVSVIPSSAQQGSTYQVVITGNLTNWLQGSTEAILGAGVTVANLTITSPTTATATIAVSPTAPVGANSVIMITGTEIDTGTGFSVTPSAASISTIQPGFTCSTLNGVTGGPANCDQSYGIPVVSQLQTVTLHISATGTHWLQGETTVNWEDQNGNPDAGIHLDSLTVNSPTSADIQFTVLSTAPVGFTSLTMITDGEVITLDKAIDVEEGFAKLLAFSPGGGQQGNTMTMQILGRFTHWDSTTTAAFAPAGDLTVNSVHVIDSEIMTLNVTVSPWAYVDYWYPCGHTLTITTTDVTDSSGSVEQVSTDPNATGNFCVAQGAEQINSVSPLTGVQGSTETVTISGSATNFLAGVTTVSFGDPNFQVGQITVNSPTSLSVPVGISTAASTGLKQVTVSTYGQTATQQYSFTVTPGIAILTEANPNHAEQGIQALDVILSGQYSHFSPLSTATFGSGVVVNSVTYNSPTQITANISIDPLSYAGGRAVTVTTPGVSCADQPVNVTYNGCAPGATTGTGSEIVTASAFTIIPGPAIISNVSPNTGNEGQEVVFNLTGSATHWQQNFTQFYMSGAGSDITVNSVLINSATSATVDISISPTANAGARSIFMVTDGESLTDSGAFVVTGGIPVITYLTPNNAVQGTNQLQVVVNGNAYTQWDSTSTVNFGPGVTIASLQVDDASHISAVINIDPAAQVGYRTVTVQTGAQVLAGNFQVTAPAPPPTPYISYYWPTSGLTGQTLTVHFSGLYTHWDPGPINSPTTVTYGDGIAMNWEQVLSPTQYVANITIAADAVPGPREFVFSTGSENEAVSFNVVSSQPGATNAVQPTLSIVDPGSGMQGSQNLTATILGQYTSFDNTTTFTFGPGITVNGPPAILGSNVATQSISISAEAPTGSFAVTAYTPDAPTSNEQVVGGASFTVTPSLALILAVTPNTALQGNTIRVDVTGQNTHWDGSTTFQVGAGIAVSNVIVNSATDASITLTIPALAPLGATYVTATTLGEVATLGRGFVVQAGTPLLLSSGPGSLPQQSSAIFTILSQATHWLSSAPTVSYGAGVVLTNINVTSDTSLTVDGYVQPTTYVGWRNLTVVSGTQVLGLQNAFYINPGPAVINSVTASTAGQGDTLTVTIDGTNTNWQQGVTQLSFPGVLINSLTVNSANSITANITVSTYAPAGQVSVTATTLGEVATGANVFTISQTQPELLAVVVGSGAQGVTENVNLTGAFTHFVSGQSSGNTTASFGAGVTVNSVTANSANSLTVNITVQATATLGYRNVSVTTGSEVVSLQNAFNITVGPAAIYSLAPPRGAQGNTYSVVVTGSQSHFAQGVTTASFGGGIQVTAVSVTDQLHSTVSIAIPNGTGLGQYDVNLTTGGEVATMLGGFTVTTGTPRLSAVSPATGHQGDKNISISLTGLFTHFVSGTSSVSFGAGITVNSLIVIDATDAVSNLTINSTAATGSRTVTLTTGAETASMTGGFTVLAGIPALVSSTPGSAQAGASANIVITGAFTTFQQGFTSVSFGSGVSVNFVTVSSTTQLTASITIASNATVGSRDVQVTTNGQTYTLASAFSVLAGTPVITQISPNIGAPNSTVPITITGQYTNWGGTSTLTIGDGAVISVSNVQASATSLTATLSIPASAALGPYDVVVATGGEVENVPGGFTVQAAAITPPSLISLSPGPNAGGVPINSNFTAVFSQPMNRTTLNTSTVLMWLVSNPGGWVSVPGTVNVDATGRLMTFTPNALLAVNAEYYMLLTGGIQDASGNPFSQYGYVGFSTVFTASTTAPVVTAANPPANTTVAGTNVPIQIEFSAPMNQSTQSGLIVSSGGTPIAGTLSWDSNPYSPLCCWYWGQGSLLTFTPTTPLLPGTTYTVSYGAPLADTAGNALTPGSFTFTTGAGADTSYNYTGLDFVNGVTNVGTNFVPKVTFTKPVNPLDINSGTLLLYNADSGKYIQGTVALAPDGQSATFTPANPLLPDTYYYIHMAWGYYDMDGNYLSGNNGYFTTGAGQDLAPPTVTSVYPADSSISVPLNSQIVAHFSEAIDPSSPHSISVAPSGGSPIAGTATLSSDQLTLTFVPAALLQPGTSFAVQISGYQDMAGNAGAAFSSTFSTMNSVAPLNLSTGLDASGNLITTGDTPDAHWTVTPAGASTPQPLLVVAQGNADWCCWQANGPSSSWIAINPDTNYATNLGPFSTTFNLSGYNLNNLCLVGQMGQYPNGTLLLNGIPITADFAQYNPLSTLSVSLPQSALNAGTNTLSLQWDTTSNSWGVFRLQATLQTCGAKLASGLSLVSATPSTGSTNVATNTAVTLNFNNPIDPATVNVNTLPIMVGWNGGQGLAGTYQVNGSQVVFTPQSPFPVNTIIYVGNCNGPFDTAGDAIPGCYSYQLDYFTTSSTATPVATPFQVIAFAPGANATNVGLRAPVVATFNRSINPSTINANNAALFSGDSQSPWCASYSRSQDNTTLQFTCYPLPSSDPMTAILNSGLQDWQGNALTSFTSQFTTAQYDSNTDGSVISTRPGNGASSISANQPIVLYTNLPINPSTATGGIEVAQNNAAVPGTVQVLDNGYALEFTPSIPWAPGAFVQWWTTGSLLDTTYNTPINGASGYFYVVADTSTAAPTVQAISPTNGNYSAPPNSIFDIQLNTPLDPATVTSDNIYIRGYYSGTYVAGTYSMPQPNVVRIVPSGLLNSNDYYLLYVTTGLHSSTSVPANSVGGFNVYVYTGAPIDNTLPLVTSAVPFNGASGVGVNVQPGVIFNKPIDPISVNSSTFQVTNAGTPLVGNYWFSSDDTRVEFVPNAPLPANASLTMSLNGVIDRVGNPVNYSATFQTAAGPDFTAPFIVYSSVASGESLPINSSITVQFSESMDVTTFSSGNFYIVDALRATVVPATLSWSADQSVAYLVPSASLSAGRAYYLYIYGGTDLAGNGLQYNQVSFYAELTASSTAPTMIKFNPINGAANVGINAIIEAQFSDSIDPNTLGGVTLSGSGSTVMATPAMSAGNTVLQLTPQTPLAPNTTYTMTISGVKDPAGNVVATTTNSFTTGASYDIVSASLVSYNPPSNSTAGTNVTPKLVFSKPLNPIMVSNGTFELVLNDSGQFIPLTVTLSPDGKVVTLQPKTPLLPNTQYRFYVGYNNLQDENGNSVYGGWYYFTTSSGPVTASPTVTVSPANGATGVPLNAEIVVLSSATIDPTSWSQSSIQVLNGSTPVNGVVSQTNSQSLTFAPTTTEPAGTYVGCYNDTGNRVLNGYSTSSGNMTVESCVSTCGAQGFTYAGLQAGSSCFCGNGRYNSAGQGNACNYTCSGNAGETCGGSWANSVYTANSGGVAGLFAANTTYTVNLGGFADANSNTVVPSSSTFTTGALTSAGGLTFTGSNIGWGATVTSYTQPIVMTFSQNLDPATVNSSTLEVMNGWNPSNPLPGTYVVSGNQVTFTPASPYPSGASIFVGECGGPTDVLGDVFFSGNCWQQQLVYFVVPAYSTQPPTGVPTSLTVLSVSPADGATNVGREHAVSITFSNPMNSGTGGGYNTQLYAGQDLQQNGSQTWSADGRTMTFNVGALSNGAKYTVAIPAGGITDEWGNTLTQPFTSTFTTVADPAAGNGGVQGVTPSWNASGIPANTLLTLYMNRQVDPSTIAGSLTVTINGQVYAGTVQAVASNYELQFTPSTPFPNGATVQWFLSGGVMDVYGNNVNGNSGTFYTAPAPPDPATAQPQIVAISPACCGSTNVPTNAEIDIQYSLPIDPATVSSGVGFYNGNTGWVTPSITLTSPNIIRMTLPGGLAPATPYYVCASNGNLKGTNGVAVQTYCYWADYFTAGTTADTTPGNVTIGPPNGVVNVGTNAYIRLQFSKPVDVTTINSSSVQISTSGVPIPGAWSWNSSGGNVVGANFYPVNPLPPSTVISVSVTGLLDYAGNTFTAANSTFTTAPLPDYTTPSVSLDFGYWQGGIATNASFNCRYSEPIDPSSVNAGNTYVYSYVNGTTIPVTYTWSSDLMTVTMTPTSPLFANSQYYYACQGAIDLTGNGQNNNSAGFVTGAGPLTAGPVLLYSNPPNGMTNVAVNTNNGPWYGSSLGLLFNEPVAGDSLGQITLTPAGGSPIPISAYPEYGNTIVWVQLPWALQPNTTYTYNVNGVTDMSGNMMTPTTSTFTTGASFDWTSPVVTSTIPANGAGDVAPSTTSVSFTFSEPMDPVLINAGQFYLRLHNTGASVPATVTVSPDYTTVILAPTTPLAESTIYDLVIYPYSGWWPTDIAGNGMSASGYIGWNNGYIFSTFTTGAATPVDGVCGTANGQSFSSAPTANLCSAGSPSAITNPGSWTWSCNGQYGGATASCSAGVTLLDTPVAQPAGLVSWWPGNDNPNDIVGGNNGTLENGAGYALGEVGDAFSLNGNNQFVLIGQPVPANLQIQNAITLSAWIYPTAYPTNYGSGAFGFIVGSQQDGSPSGGATLFFSNDGRTNAPPGHVDFQIGDGSNWHDTYTESQLPLNQWTLVTATRTANTASANIYFNGVSQPVASPDTPWNGAIAYPSGDWFSIGQEVNENRPFNGLINQVQVYNVALSPAQIQSIYNAGSAGMVAVQTASTTTVSSSASPAQLGAPVTFTASVSPSSATGTIVFMDGGISLGTATLSGGMATLTTSALTLGVHPINALYNGDSTYSGSLSTAINQLENLDGARCAPQPAGLLNWYPAEGNAVDLLGGNNGIVEGGVSYAPGVVGQAFRFAGSGDVALTLPSINTAPGTQVTVAFWMNWSGNDNEMPFGFTSRPGTSASIQETATFGASEAAALPTHGPLSPPSSTTATRTRINSFLMASRRPSPSSCPRPVTRRRWSRRPRSGAGTTEVTSSTA